MDPSRSKPRSLEWVCDFCLLFQLLPYLFLSLIQRYFIHTCLNTKSSSKKRRSAMQWCFSHQSHKSTKTISYISLSLNIWSYLLCLPFSITYLMRSLEKRTISSPWMGGSTKWCKLKSIRCYISWKNIYNLKGETYSSSSLGRERVNGSFGQNWRIVCRLASCNFHFTLHNSKNTPFRVSQF